jgi:hypothetical protein
MDKGRAEKTGRTTLRLTTRPPRTQPGPSYLSAYTTLTHELEIVDIVALVLPSCHITISSTTHIIFARFFYPYDLRTEPHRHTQENLWKISNEIKNKRDWTDGESAIELQLILCDAHNRSIY